MAVNGLHHVSINVTDLDRAVRFYTDVLRLQPTTRPPFDFPGAWFQIGSQQVHLIVHSARDVPAGTATLDTQRAHFALRVDSYREMLAHLKALDVPCLERPQNKTPWPQIYLRDPDGNLIELNAEGLD